MLSYSSLTQLPNIAKRISSQNLPKRHYTISPNTRPLPGANSHTLGLATTVSSHSSGAATIVIVFAILLLLLLLLLLSISVLSLPVMRSVLPMRELSENSRVKAVRACVRSSYSWECSADMRAALRRVRRKSMRKVNADWICWG